MKVGGFESKYLRNGILLTASIDLAEHWTLLSEVNFDRIQVPMIEVSVRNHVAFYLFQFFLVASRKHFSTSAFHLSGTCKFAQVYFCTKFSTIQKCSIRFAEWCNTLPTRLFMSRFVSSGTTSIEFAKFRSANKRKKGSLFKRENTWWVYCRTGTLFNKFSFPIKISRNFLNSTTAFQKWLKVEIYFSFVICQHDALPGVSWTRKLHFYDGYGEVPIRKRGKERS